MNQILYSGKTKKNIEFNINKSAIATIAIIVFILLIFLLSTIFAFINKNNTNILSNIAVGNIDLSNLSKEVALDKLKDQLLISTIPDFVDVNVDGNMYTVDATKLKIEYDYSSTVDTAYNIGRNSNFIVNNYIILKTVLFGENVSPICKVDEESFDNFSKDLTSCLNIENLAVDTSYEIKEDKLIVTKGTDGNSLDTALLKNTLISAYIKNDYSSISTNIIQKTADKIDIDKLYTQIHIEPVDAQKIEENGVIKFQKAVDGISFDIDNAKELVANSDSNSIEIPLITTKPSISNEMIVADMLNDVIATYSTEFDSANINRAENIRIATDKINGTILLPEDEFSFNNIVGDRTELAGFKLATVYSHGEMQEGIGGGICQVSSTLYNTALLSNLQITERRNHSYSVSYVPLGQDATVTYGVTDLKFKNNRATPIKIEALIDGNTLKINILGTKSVENYDEIKIENVTTQTTPFTVQETEVDTLEKGKTETTQKGKEGYIVETYVILYKNRLEVSRSLVSTSTYMPLQELVNVGTKVSSSTSKKTTTKKSTTTKKNTTPTTPTTPVVPETPYTPPTLPPGWDVPENPYR